VQSILLTKFSWQGRSPRGQRDRGWRTPEQDVDPGVGILARLRIIRRHHARGRCQIGSGIFLVSADMARLIGSPGWLLIAWGIAGAITIAGALSYGELSAMMPQAGGMYVYLPEAYSPLWGFLYGWTLFTVISDRNHRCRGGGFRAVFRRALADDLGKSLPDCPFASPRTTLFRYPPHSSSPL
jgi:amino acid permease-like protein